MGGKSSKFQFLSYEDALRRVSEAELKRLKEAFRRASSANGFMSCGHFIRDVLGETVPKKLAEEIFNVLCCGGSGLNFKELLIGLILLTRGKQEEKYKFLFAVYSNESGTHIERSEMERRVLEMEGRISQPQALEILFKFCGGSNSAAPSGSSSSVQSVNSTITSDRATYDQFRMWVICNPAATEFCSWLLMERCVLRLSDDTETATFYQTLAGVTHLDEADILELEKRYWTLKGYSQTGRLDLATFRTLISPPVPESVVGGLFAAFDENCDDHIDFKEMCCGVSACSRGPITERQKFCFRIFDQDRDGYLSMEELEMMIAVFLQTRAEAADDPSWRLASASSGGQDPAVCAWSAEERLQVERDACAMGSETIAREILQAHDGDEDLRITLSEYLMWTVDHPLPEHFLRLLFQVCHVILGLKPQFRQDELDVVQDWLAREDLRGFQPGQSWYLVSMKWWRAWKNYVEYCPNVGNYGSISASSESTTSSIEPFLQLQANHVSGHDISAYNTTKQKSVSMTNMAAAMNSNGYGNSATMSSNHWRSQSTRLDKRFVVSTNSASSNNNSPSPSPNGSPLAGSSRKLQSQVGSSAPQKPGPIDNSILLAISTGTPRPITLTNEGGVLRKMPDSSGGLLTRGRDFEVLPEPLWRAVHAWYGGGPALPRLVLNTPHKGARQTLELYPYTCLVLKHSTPTVQRPAVSRFFSGVISATGSASMVASTLGISASSNVVAPSGAGPSLLNGTSSSNSVTNSSNGVVRRIVSNSACFSRKHTVGQVHDFLAQRLNRHRDDLRIWKFKDEQTMTLLEEFDVFLEDLDFEDNQQLLVEIRNHDLTWPEELLQLTKNKSLMSKRASLVRGVAGLNNLGNTCFLNSALQCVSNTQPLTAYFTNGLHFYELNRINPLGMRGHMAVRYGELVKDLWSGTTCAIAPLKLRLTISQYENRFIGHQQHDAQELLSFLLDGLHEDLNRVREKTYVELKDSDGRADEEVAAEAWDNHIRRNQSIVVDLFHGQMRSAVRCQTCGFVSVKFDPFSALSLPLPMESWVPLEIVVFRLTTQSHSSAPIRYGHKLAPDDKFSSIKTHLSKLCDVAQSNIFLLEVSVDGRIRSFPQDKERVRGTLFDKLFAYLMPSLEEETTLLLPENDDVIQQEVHSPSLCSSSKDEASTKLGQDVIKMPPQSVVTNESNPNQRSFLVTFHRKYSRQEAYFLSHNKSRPSIFGLPLMLEVNPSRTRNIDIYAAVWRQVARLVSPLPPSQSSVDSAIVDSAFAISSKNVSLGPTPSNHALDCDDSLCQEYPFVLSRTDRCGQSCAICPWTRFCRGCPIPCDRQLINLNKASVSTSPTVVDNAEPFFLAIDWEPTALHLRYQAANEHIYETHPSLEECSRASCLAINLHDCLQAFTREEDLGPDDLVYCSKCKEQRRSFKKLDLWKLPPILIIHMKRFQFVNNRWVKSHKVVDFPSRGLDFSNYLKYRHSNGIDEDVLGKSDLYDLYAITCHSGLLGGGHYIAYAKNPNERWYIYNDSSCKEINETSMDWNGAYILFFQRRDLDHTAFLPDTSRLGEPDLSPVTDEVDSEIKRMCVLQ